MRPHHARAVGLIVPAVVVWLSCLPVVSACEVSISGERINCGISTQDVIGIIVAMVFFVAMCAGGCLRRRQLRNRALRLSYAPNDGTRRPSPNMPKPYNIPILGGYPARHQTAPPTPLPVHMPQYPPRGYDTSSYGRSRSQITTVHRVPEPAVPVSPPPPSVRAPPSVTSRPISSLVNTTPPSLRFSVRRDDPATMAPPPSSPPPALPHSAQRIVAESPLPSSPPPRSPTAAVPPASAPSPHPSGAIPPLNAAHPLTLAPMHTGTSNIDEPPPAYTPL